MGAVALEDDNVRNGALDEAILPPVFFRQYDNEERFIPRQCSFYDVTSVFPSTKTVVWAND